jgi:hypothetical protein
MVMYCGLRGHDLQGLLTGLVDAGVWPPEELARERESMGAMFPGTIEIVPRRLSVMAALGRGL